MRVQLPESSRSTPLLQIDLRQLQLRLWRNARAVYDVGLQPPAIVSSGRGSLFAPSSRVTHWVNVALGYGLPIAIIYLLSRRRQDNAEGFLSAYRLLLTIMLIGVIVLLIPAIRNYADLVLHGAQASRAMTAPQKKMSAADLESHFVHVNRLPPTADFRCKRSDHDWDYVCSYKPIPSQSKKRVMLGVTVDDKRLLATSGVVPEGAILPPPR